MAQDRALTDAELLALFKEPRADLSLLSRDERARLVRLTEPTPNQQAPALDRYVEGLAETNPITTGVDFVEGLFTGETPKAVVETSANYLDRAVEAHKQGRPQAAFGEALSAVPLIGPYVRGVVDEAREGNVAGALGQATWGLLPGAKAGVKAGGRKVLGPVRAPNPNPQMADAVRFGQQQGIPVDASTARGNRWVNAVQSRVENSMGGAGVSERFRTKQAEQFERVGRQLVDEAQPGQQTSPFSAGEAVREGLTGKIERLDQTATSAYDALRQMESRQPAAGMVDLAPVKGRLTPIYNELAKENSIVPFHSGSGKARALIALERLLKGTNSSTLSVVDAALGELKALARGAEMPQLRTQGQGIAAQAVAELEAAVQRATENLGPDAVRARTTGRAATTAKWNTGDFLEGLSKEPGQVFKQLTQGDDRSAVRLRELSNMSPDVVPTIGRALLEDLMDTAMRDGKFGHGAKLWADWMKVGPETKRVLFTPEHVKKLDNFFRLAKEVTESSNWNTSRTAHTLTALNVASVPATYSLARMLFSEQGVNYLTGQLNQARSGVRTAAAKTVRISGRTAAWGGRGIRELPMAAESDPERAR